MALLSDMELFDELNEVGGHETNAMSEDDLPSEEDDDDDIDDDENELNTTDVSHGNCDIKKPLAGMLPNTYEGKTAEELFPDFRPNAILQFNKIFGSGKSNHLPKPWAHLRKRTVEEIPPAPEQSEIRIDEFEQDNETIFLSRLPPVVDEPVHDGQGSPQNDAKVANWRVGPARLWYDQIGVSLEAMKFDYGFKTKSNPTAQSQTSRETTNENDPLPDNKSLPINLIRWEDEIIYDSNIARDRLDLNTPKIRYCGWVPTTSHRSLASFQKNVFGKNVDYLEDEDAKSKTWYSIFPIDNYELMYGDWEDDIVIDPESMERVRDPPELILDENDDNLIFEIPNDPNENLSRQRNRDGAEKSDLNNSTSPTKGNKAPPKDYRGRVTKRVLTGSGILKETEEDEEEANEQTETPKNDFWNLSNDEFYNPRSIDSVGKSLGSINLQHATPAVELVTQLFPTHLSVTKLRHFHRPTIKKFQQGKLKPGEFQPVQSIHQISENRAAEREKERQAYGGGEMFYMRRLADLSGLDSDVVLAEYCEQYPPLLNQIGMATRVKNYYKKKPGKQDNPPMCDYGEISYAHSSPFQAEMSPGEIVQAFENHMFRAPIFQHRLMPTDFLILRTKHSYHIRNMRAIFSVGQECPLQEVPGPNSKRANNFARDFLQAYIFRLYWKSRDNPPRIKMEDVRKAFPQNAENSIRKRLKTSSDFKRTGGVHCNWWVLRNDFRLPTQEEIRQLVTPEQCCAYYSMQAAEQRLKDAGYGEKVLFAAIDEDAADENDTSKIEDEVKCAPWHTTKAYLDSLKGKCWLQLRGFADPTGCGEGFSYVRVSNKPNAREVEPETAQAKKMVTGTDADLRRLHLKEAKKILNRFGVSESDIRNLSRWQIIDIVRTMSTARARDGEDGAAMAKFARGNRYSQTEYQEKYKEECRKIFDAQKKSLSSNNALSTDNESSAEEDSDADEMGKNLELMLESAVSKQSLNEKNQNETMDTTKKTGSRVLRIVRTFIDNNGREYQRTETVRKPMVVEAYSKIRQTKDDDFIRQFYALDEDQRENLRRERRRLQEQLRRVRRQDRLQQKNNLTESNVNMDAASPLSLHSSNPSPIRNMNSQMNTSDLSNKLNLDRYSFMSQDHNISDDQNGDLFSENHGQGTNLTNIFPSMTSDNFNGNSQSSFFNFLNQNSLLDEGQEQSEMISPTSSVKPTNSASGAVDPSNSNKRKRKSEKDAKSLKCGACGAQGHMRTNRVCPMYGKSTGNNPSTSQTSLNVENEDAQHSFDLPHTEMSNSMCVTDVSVKMVEGHGTKLIIAKSSTESKSQRQSNKDPANRKSKKLKNVKSTGAEAMEIEEDSFNDSQHSGIYSQSDPSRPSTPPAVVHVSNIPFDPLAPMAQKNLTYTPTASGHSKSNFPQSTGRRKSSTTPTTAGPNSKTNPNYASATSTPLSTGPLGTMFAFPPTTPSSSSATDYLDKPTRTVQRRRIDPLVSFATLLESVLNELRDMPEATLFLSPVNSRSYPSYYEIIKNPIDFQKIRQRVLAHSYNTRESFLNDIKRIVENSRKYNGEHSSITRDAQTIVAACFQKFAANEDKFMKLEKAINPLLDDNLIVAISYLFERILTDHLMNIEGSWPFHQPVNKLKFKDYYQVVKTPMDFEKIRSNINKHRYRSRTAMLNDIKMLYSNSVLYNGESHFITVVAAKIVRTCEEQFAEHAEQFDLLERSLEQQDHMTARTTDSLSNDESFGLTAQTDLIFSGVNQEDIDYSNPAAMDMSLETFISRDAPVIDQELQNMINEEHFVNTDNSQTLTEKVTTEDILGNISESDSSDDDND